VNYDTVQWVLIALVFVLVYGVGLLLLLYVPIRRYIVRRDIRTRELYITTQAVVYKVCSIENNQVVICKLY
jgi:membrane protein YdbS with pleckstrin-like domain